MTQTIIEKVARAICVANGVRPDEVLYASGRVTWTRYKAHAKAAIEALAAGVTDEMCMACVVTRNNPGITDQPRSEQVRIGVQSAIRAALEE